MCQPQRFRFGTARPKEDKKLNKTAMKEESILNNNIAKLSLSINRGSHIKSDYAHTVIKHTLLLAHIPGTCTLIFSSCNPFYSLSQPHHVTASHPSPCDNPPENGRRSRRKGHAKMAALNSLIYICPRALHSFLSSAIERNLYRHPSAAHGHLHAIHPT